MMSGLASEGGFPSFLEAQAQLGRKLTWRRSYDSVALPASYATSGCGKDWGDKLWSAYSFAGRTGTTAAEKAEIKQYLIDFGNGMYDDRVASWMRSIPKDGPFVDIAIAHEADAKVNKGVYTPAIANAAAQRLRQIVDSRRAAGDYQAIHQVRVASCLTAYYWNPGNKSAANNKMDDFLLAAEICAADPYGKGQYRATGLVDEFYAWCKLKNRASALWEFSTQSTTAEGRDVWIKEMFSYSKTCGADYIIGFNSTVNGSDAILSTPESLKAYRDAMRDYTVYPTKYPTDTGGGTTVPVPPQIDLQEGMSGTLVLASW